MKLEGVRWWNFGKLEEGSYYEVDTIKIHCLSCMNVPKNIYKLRNKGNYQSRFIVTTGEASQLEGPRILYILGLLTIDFSFYINFAIGKFHMCINTFCSLSKLLSSSYCFQSSLIGISLSSRSRNVCVSPIRLWRPCHCAHQTLTPSRRKSKATHQTLTPPPAKGQGSPPKP